MAIPESKETGCIDREEVKIILIKDDIQRIKEYLNYNLENIDDVLIKIVTQP